MRGLCLAVLAGAFVGLSACDAGDDEPAPGNDQATQGFELVHTVQRLAEGTKETPAERAEAVRIINHDPELAPLLEDGGGYSLKLKQTGPINGPGHHRFIGVITTIRLDEPVSGIYDFPALCLGLKNQRFRLAPFSFEVTNIRSFYVETGFESGEVIQASPVGDRYQLAPGASVPDGPTTCERRSRRDAGE